MENDIAMQLQMSKSKFEDAAKEFTNKYAK